ncbi:MLO-like protein 9 [Papaver somniferum]|uniref:MLO-like protein 9 n=1 Tax=Papaver somniferum TaxID=3469 RepID=UPI000E70103E|nr:MLO-like protein 9 [Papaver somniferum]
MELDVSVTEGLVLKILILSVCCNPHIMAVAANSQSRELDQTPTWAVATVVAIILIISISLEKVLHRLGKWFTERHKKALFEALEKVKCELMVLGFISLLLTFGQGYIARICIPLKAAETMLPCPARHVEEKDDDKKEEHRRLLWVARRILAAGAGGGEVFKCNPGFEPLISEHGIHQLHIFIFFLAVFHVAYSATTMGLGRLKIRGWKEWEKETSSHDYEFSNDPSRFRLTHETSFVRIHSRWWNRIPVIFYFACFFRQFFRSVRKADYLTLRHGFISVHLASGSTFDFQKYIKRSLEDDFKVVVGISPVLWGTLVIFLLLNVSGWQTLFWASIIPLLIILAVGRKLQAIITKMALEITERYAVVQGIPLVQVSDKHFWFSRPQLVLYLIHFTLFQNAFQLTYFFWIWFEFGLKSCFHQNFTLIIIRIALGVAVQLLCSYVTLPLYALVTQMGSTMKKSIFDEQMSKAIMKWRAAAKKKNVGKSARSTGPSVTSTPSHPLHRFKTTGYSTRSFMSSLSNKAYSDTELSDMETDHSPESATATLIANMERGDVELESEIIEEHTRNEDDFSFVKPALR